MRQEQISIQDNEVTRLTITSSRITLKIAKKDSELKEQLIFFARLIANEPEMVETAHSMRGTIENFSVVMQDDAKRINREYSLEKDWLVKKIFEKSSTAAKTNPEPKIFLTEFRI